MANLNDDEIDEYEDDDEEEYFEDSVEDDFEDDDEEDDLEDICAKAGTEECDWECPFSR